MKSTNTLKVSGNLESTLIKGKGFTCCYRRLSLSFEFFIAGRYDKRFRSYSDEATDDKNC